MLKSLAIGVFLLVNLQCGKVTPPPVVTLGEGKLGVVQFPGEFTRDKVDSWPITTATLINTLHYEIRRKPGSSHELIFTMIDVGQQGEPVESDDFYAVTLDGKFKTRRATAAEWRAATKLTVKREDDRASDRDREVSVGKDGVRYQGKLYPTAAGISQTETRGFISPGAKWLVVFSDDSKPTNRQGIPGFSGGGRTAGHMFIDVYDTKSGNKVLAGSAAHVGCASCLFNYSIWVGDNYFVVPLDPPGTDTASVGVDCFLAILPNQ